MSEDKDNSFYKNVKPLRGGSVPDNSEPVVEPVSKPAERPAGLRPGGPMAAFGMPVEKPKNFKGTLKRLISYLKPQMLKIILVIIFAILSTVFAILSPKITGNAITKIYEGYGSKMALQKIEEIQKDPNIKKLLPSMKISDISDVKDNAQKAQIFRQMAELGKRTPNFNMSDEDIDKMAGIIRETGGKIDFRYIFVNVFLWLIGLYILSAGFSFLQQYIMSTVAQKVVYDMRNDMNNKLSRLPLKFFDSKTHGEILSRMANDIDNIATTLQQNMTQLITSIATILGAVVMMLTISVWLTLITIVTLPLSAIAAAIIAKRSQKYFKGQQKSLGELNGHVEEMFTGHIIVKAFGQEKTSINKFKEVNDGLYTHSFKAQFITGIIMPVLSFINNIGYVLISVVGGIFAIKKMIELGDIIAFIQYTRQFTMPIVQTANIANIIQSTIASSERVFELLDEEEEKPDSETAITLRDPDGKVEFNNVKFSYKEDITIIHNLSLVAYKGQTIAIVGPTGAGKTTLVNLLMRFYEIDDGEIRVDNVDIRNIKRGSLRGIFGMVLQDTWLFNGTIRDNIAYGLEGATEEEIVEAAKAAHADHFIRTLPEGYNTILNEEASNISGGQKQLLTIARAVLAKPSILILDEATSNVDTRTEVLIQKAMLTLMRGRTSFVIAHRLSTIRDAGLILVMNNGDVIEKGSHKELIAMNGFYAELYNSQFTGAEI